MSSSVYKIIEVVGTSNASWEAAAKNAVEIAGQSPGGPAHRRGGTTGYEDHGRQSRRFPCARQDLLQVQR